MALTSKGSDIVLVRNDATGKFTYRMSASGTNKGNPEFDDSRTHACMTTLFSWKRGKLPGDSAPQGGYYWDTAGRRGTLLWTVKYDRQATRSDLISAAQDAGQQLVDDKLIVNYSVDAQRLGVGRWLLLFGWTLPTGDRKDFPGGIKL
jgi:phage gp46-like protein